MKSNARKNEKFSLLTTVSVSVSVTVSTMTMESSSGSDLHFQLFALGGVRWHGVTVVGPEAALALRSHRFSQLIGCIRAGAPAAQIRVLLDEDMRNNQMNMIIKPFYSQENPT